jgi:hypothetical protein
MRTLLSLSVVLVALAGSCGQLLAAPVPADKPAPSLEGKYTLLSVSTPEDRPGPGGGGPVAGGFPGGGGVMRVRPGLAATYMVGPAAITKNRITIEGRGNVISPLAAGLHLPLTMEYTIDTTKTPMTIDINNVSLRGKKTKALGLVEVNEDRVILAVAKEGDERPKNMDEAGDVTVYYFQKAPPPPKVEFKIVAMTVGKEADAEKELNKLASQGFELVNTTNPAASDGKSSPTTVHFILRRTVKP